MQRKNNFIHAVHVIVLLSACVLAAETGYAQENPGRIVDRDSVIAAAREIMGLQTYCALVTLDSAGGPGIRTMNPFPPEADMSVWMATNSRSRKAEHIRHNSRVCLYYADHNVAKGYVTITGRAVLVDDMNEKLKRKRAYWDQSFPDWQYLLLIKVIPERIEVINYKHKMYNDAVTFQAPSVNIDE